MQMTQLLLQEMEAEALTTRRMLSRAPNDKYDWKPHEKSMSIRQLATHIAELPGWVTIALNTSELDFASQPYQPTAIANSTELLAFFEKTLAEGRAALAAAKEEDLLPNWTLRNGEEIYNVYTRASVIRMSVSQTIHHRAQLGVYLRLLNIPIPGSYGPSADEQRF